jgi:hypothetical protein
MNTKKSMSIVALVTAAIFALSTVVVMPVLASTSSSDDSSSSSSSGGSSSSSSASMKLDDFKTCVSDIESGSSDPQQGIRDCFQQTFSSSIGTGTSSSGTSSSGSSPSEEP